MAHTVRFTLPERNLGKSDIQVKVKRNGKFLGELRISKGNVEWRPTSKQYGYKVGWSRFDELMRENGRR